MAAPMLEHARLRPEVSVAPSGVALRTASLVRILGPFAPLLLLFIVASVAVPGFFSRLISLRSCKLRR